MDGDGWFTSTDVLFAQEYVALGPLATSVPTCVAARCLWSWELDPWQQCMLHPVEDPKVTPGPPAVEDPDFPLRALAGKLWFLSNWDVLASKCQLRVTAIFLDYAGRQALTDHTLVSVELCTSHNKGLPFTTVARWTASTTCWSVKAAPNSTAALDSGFNSTVALDSGPNSTAWVIESLPGARIYSEQVALSFTVVTLDPLLQAADPFTFLPGSPLALNPIHALPPPASN